MDAFVGTVEIVYRGGRYAVGGVTAVLARFKGGD